MRSYRARCVSFLWRSRIDLSIEAGTIWSRFSGFSFTRPSSTSLTQSYWDDSNSLNDRTKALKSVFPDGAHSLNFINQAKRAFLNQGTIKTVGNRGLQQLLFKFRDTFSELHLALQAAFVVWKEWKLAHSEPNWLRVYRNPRTCDNGYTASVVPT
jgi:hypothetical protein